jgi:hypothetical protein
MEDAAVAGKVMINSKSNTNVAIRVSGVDRGINTTVAFIEGWLGKNAS